MQTEVLIVDNLHITSENEVILYNINFNLFRGELLTIFGAHESGNAVLAKAVSGFSSITRGGIYINEQRLRPHTYEQAQKMGVFYVGRHSMLISSMTVEENLFAIKKTKSTNFLYNKKVVRKQAEVLLKKYGFKINLDKYVCELSEFHTLIIQIIKVILMDAKIIIFDDFSRSIYSNNYLKLLHFIRKQQNASFIYISNIVDKIVENSDKIAVMRKGKIVKHMCIEEYSYSYLIKCAFGRQLIKSPKREVNTIGKNVFKIKGLLVGDKTLNLSVGESEVVGVLDLDGSGKEIIRKLTEECLDGITVDGEDVSTYEKAVSLGMAVIKSRFDFNDYFTCFDTSKNLTFQLLKKISRFGVINRNLEQFLLKNLEYDISEIKKDSSHNLFVLRTLLYRKILMNPKIIIIDNIASGFDMKVSEELFCILDQEAKKKVGILAIFSDIVECFNFCDKIFVPKTEGNIYRMYLKEDYNLSEITSLIDNIKK